MDIYLPIAGLSVNALVIVGLGGLVGLLTGMVGVGGGFLITPILIFYGIPPAVAVASANTQITGTSISDIQSNQQDTDRVPDKFQVGNMDFPGTVSTANGSGTDNEFPWP